MEKDLLEKLRDGSHMLGFNVDEAEEHKCLNCGTTYRGNYCPYCRQKATTKRLNLLETFKNFFGRFTKIDQGLLHTVFDLIYRPAYMVRDYINGYRTEYVDPLLLMIVLIAIRVFVPGITNDVVKPISEEYYQLLADHQIVLKFAEFLHWVRGDFQRFVIFFCCLVSPAIPFTLWILRVKNKLNLSESLHLMLYASCYSLIFSTLEKLLYFLFPATVAYDSVFKFILYSLVYFVALSMIYVCTRMKLYKIFLTFFVFPIAVILCITVLATVIVTMCYYSIPEEMVDQIDIGGFFFGV